MVKKIFVSPKSAHTPFSTYSHAVVVEAPTKTIYCAGQVAGDANGNVLGPEDFEAQGDLAIENLKKLSPSAARSCRTW